MVTPADLTIRRDAAVRRIELDDTSWFELTEGFVADPETELDRLLTDVAWQQAEVLRYDRYVPERRLVASLRSDSRPLLRQTGLHLEARHRVRFSGVAAICYRDGSDFQGLHADREMRWLDDTLIAIVVLGDRRPFAFRPQRRRASGQDSRQDSRSDGAPDRSPAGSGVDDVVVSPGRGDLLVMGGRCQRDWLHGVPGVADHHAARVSLTWRWTSRRGRPDTDPTYGDGRQFGDRPRRAGIRRR